MAIRIANLLLLVFLLHFGGLSFASRFSPQKISPVTAMKEKVFEKMQLKWGPVGWKIVFKLEVPEAPPEETFWGIAHRNEKKIVIFVRPSYTVENTAATYAHELAHVFDYAYMTDDMRAEWLRIRGLSKDLQWHNTSLDDPEYSLGEGDFAECFSWTFQKGRFNSELGIVPTKEQQSLIRKWVASMQPKATLEALRKASN